MQFSVIVEGPMDSHASSEDSWMELERFLLTNNISAQSLKGLKQGESRVLNDQLSYDQACKISDRLMDLGLESIIDPPIKPDDDEEVVATKKVSQPNTDKPSTKNSSSQISSTQTLSSQNSRSQTLSSQNSHSQTKTRNGNRKVTSISARQAAPQSVGKTTSPNRVKTGATKNVVKLAQRAHPNPSSQKPNALKNALKKEAVRSGNLERDTMPVQTAKSASKPLSSTKKSSAAVTKTPSSFSQAASDVKALFNLPAEGVINPSQSKFARGKFIATAAIACAIPLLYAAVWLAIIYLSVACTVMLYGLLGNVFAPLQWLLAPLPVLATLSTFTLAHLPYYLNRTTAGASLDLRAKDEPRLFMLATALGKVLQAPNVTAIRVNESAKVTVHQPCTIGEFFKLKQPLQSELRLSLGSALIQCLNTREACGLIARELGVYANAALRRPAFIVATCESVIKRLSDDNDYFSVRILRLLENASAKPLRKILSIALKFSHFCQQIPTYYFGWGLAAFQSSKTLIADYGDNYLIAISGTEVAENLPERLIHLQASEDSAHSEMLDGNRDRLVDNLAQYTQYTLEQNQGRDFLQQKYTEQAVVNSAKSLRQLLQSWDVHARKVTREYYLAAGIDLDKVELCSIKTLFQQQAKDEKFDNTANAYFGDWQYPLQFWRLPAENLLPSVDANNEIIKRLNNCIARIRYLSPDRQSSLLQFDKAIKQAAELKAAKKITVSGNPFHYHRCGESAKTLDRDLPQLLAQVKERQEGLRQQNAVMGERVALGLLLNSSQRELSAKYLTALATVQLVSDYTIGLAINIDELEHIRRHKPKNQVQQFQLYVRELTEKINEQEKNLRKKLVRCPYDMIDRRFPNLGNFLSSQQPQIDAANMEHEEIIIAKAKNTLAAVNWAYKQINQRAAYIASLMEKQHNVDTIKTIDKKKIEKKIEKRIAS